MKPLPAGTKVRAVADLDIPVTPPIHVSKGETGEVLAPGPDWRFGWYPVRFAGDRLFLSPVHPAHGARLEVVS